MKITNLLRWLLVLACLLSLMSYSQSADSVYHIETTDGNEFIGLLVEQNQTEVKLKTEKLGLIAIKRVDIKVMRLITGNKVIDGQYWFDNPQSTRYFWQPNAYGLKKGEGYYQNVWIFGNQLSTGLTDHLSVGVGLVPLFLFGGAPTPVWITPKVSIPVKKDKFNIGVGMLAGTVVAGSNWGDGGGAFGILYGTATIGSRDRNLSIGLGYGYSNGSWASQPVVTVSFLTRVSDRGYIVSESYVFPTGGSLISLGGRRLIKRVAIDFGLFAPVLEDMSTFIAIPWLGISVPFHKNQ
jgi:hypothetical protein